MGFSCHSLLFRLDEDSNRMAKHNYNFTLTQSIRLTMTIVSVGLTGTLLYVWVKDIFAQLQFYIMLLWILAIAGVACSAGREVVELKLVHRLKDAKLKEGKLLPEQIDEVELPSDEKSTMWKTALICYETAAPLVLASPIMFAIFK